MYKLLASTIIAATLGVSSAWAQESRTATHYGTDYHGNPTSCGRVRYNSYDTSIVALSYEDKARWPCFTELVVSGPVGSVDVVVQDTCGGCGAKNMIDMSEAGQAAVCGYVDNNCTVEVFKR